MASATPSLNCPSTRFSRFGTNELYVSLLFGRSAPLADD
jgi:hypothetical protein